MRLVEVDTIQDLREWLDEHMTGAELRVDMHGTIVIHTHLVETMGGYLHKTGEEE